MVHGRLRPVGNAPEAIERVHAAYFEAGADVAITASYQASYEGFARRGLSADATTAMLRRSVELARSARSRVMRAASGARWIGGCCRTTPEDIQRVRGEVDAFAGGGPG